MLKIAVADDEEKVLDEIETAISQYAFSNDVSVKIFKFSDGDSLVHSSMKFDLLFLDIEMKILNGIETAQVIRESDMCVPIVYITNYSKYWRSAYKVHAFDFISKPFESADISRVMNDFMLSIKESQSETVPLITDKGLVMQKLDEVCYFIVKNKKSVLVGTTFSEYIAKEYLSNIQEKLSGDQFYLVHKSCIVNLKYVQNVSKDNGIVMKDGTWLPLSQRKQKDFFYRLSRQIRN